MEIETNSTSVVTEPEQLQHQQTMTPNTQQAINQQQLSDEMVRFELLKTLEYYFSSKNLTKDQYLISQMDNEAFVALEEIAKFRKIKQLTSDLDLMKDIIRQSSQLELDASESKVRSINGLHGGSISAYRPISRLQAAPSPQQRSILILREVAPEATQEQIVELFNNREPMCSPCEKCESAGNELWYITFANEEQAQRALQYLKGELVTFMGRPIKARIKSHVIPRSNTLGSASKQGNTSGITLTPTSTPPPVQSPLLFSTSQLQSPTFVSSSSPTSSVQTPNSASFINAPNSTISPPHNQMLIPNPQYVPVSSQYAFPVGANQPPANYIIQSQDAAAGFESIQWPPNLRPYNSAPNTQSQPQIFYINNPNIYPNPVPGIKQDNNFIITQAPTGATQQPPTYMPNQPVIALNSLSSLPPEHAVVYQQSQQSQTRSGVFSQQSDETSVSKSQESPISNSVSNTSQNNNQQKASSNSMQFFNTPFYQQLPAQTRSQNSEGSQLAASPALPSQNSLSISINQPPTHPQQTISNPQTAEYPPNSYFIHTAQGSNQPPTISYLHQYQTSQQHQQPPANVYYDFIQQQQQQHQEGNKDAQSQQGKPAQIQAIQLPIHLPLISNQTTFTPHATLQIGTTGQLNHQQHQQQPTILFYNSIQPGQHPTHNIIINPALVNPPTGQQGGLQSQQQSQQGQISPKMAANAYAQYQQGFYQPHSHYQRKNNAGQNNDGSKPTLFSPTTQTYPKYNNNNMNKGKYQNKNYQSNSGSAKNTAFAYYNSPNMSHQGNSQHYNQHQSGGHHAPLHHNHHHVGYSTNYAAIQQVYSVAYNPVHSAANYDSNSSSGISTSSALSSTSHTPIRGNTNMRERSNGVESPECSDEGYVVSSSSSMPTSHTPKSDTAPAANVVATSIEQDSSTSPVKKSSKEEQAVIDPAIISISKSADSIPSSPTIIKSGGLMDVVAKTTIPETLANILTLSSNNTQDSAQADTLSPTKSNSHHYQQQAGNNKYDNNTHRSSGNNPRGVNNRGNNISNHHYTQKKNSPENGTNTKNRSNNNRKALQDNDPNNEETKNSSCNASHPKDSTPEQIESNFSSTVSTPSSFQNEEELMNSLNNCWNKKLTFAEIVQKTNSSSPTKSPTNEDSETADLGGESNGSEKVVLSPSTSPIVITSNSVQSNNSVITAE